MPNYELGFTSLEREINIDHLPVSGCLPTWLSGTLVRNGPAKFEVGPQVFRHWFDGFSMLHCFTFKDGFVSYANKFLHSRDYRESISQGKITMAGFATDPCRSIFKRAFSFFFRRPFTDNGNVNVARIADHYIAMTETPLSIEFDPRTLKTIGVFDYGKDKMSGAMTTAHPHFDFERSLTINYIVELSRISKYKVYCIPAGRLQRELIGAVPVREPAYMHSFGMTENYVILAEFPLVVNPLRLLLAGKPFIENYQWKPSRGTRFLLVNKRDGSVRSYSSEAFFAFHHVNAFEKGGDIFVDIASYTDSSIIEALYLERLRAGDLVPRAELRRYRLPADGKTADYELLTTESIELPRINYRLSNARDYRYAYGTGNRPDRPADFPDQLVKVDVHERSAKVWWQENCYPGEPVFVPAPHSAAEDDGVVLSIVLNAAKGNSFLLVLDAASFTEVARAEVPHHIPFGFHGQFFHDD
jgi:beta,beta-carotene 9',10'-dioxygenase